MNFKTFTERYLLDNDRIGDIVRDMHRDSFFPWNINKNLKYLKENGACFNAIVSYKILLKNYKER